MALSKILIFIMMDSVLDHSFSPFLSLNWPEGRCFIMKNILFPLDLYQNSQSALKQALTFLLTMGGHFNVFLLKTYMVPVSSSEEVIDTHDELQSQLLKKLQEVLKITKKLVPDEKMSFETLLQMGKPVNVIARVVKEKNIAYVVLGPLSSSAQEETTYLLSHISCPIVVLPL